MTKRPDFDLAVDDSRRLAQSPVKPGAGAPNVVAVVLDDLGFAQLGCFGADIKTPAIDRLATEGLRYNRFHVTSICSGTRASLLTGRNHHAVGMGYLTNVPLVFPGYTGSIPKSAAALPRLLRDAGYSTLAVGKWHLVPKHESSPAGPFDRWPLGLGFERYYGLLGGETDQWVPDLVEDNHYVEPPARPDEGYHFTEDLTDAAIRMVMDQQYSAPGKPFFLYFAPGAMHSPHQVPPEWVAAYEGQFDGGWDRLRDSTFSRQIEMGVVPPDTKLTERPPWVAAWDDLAPDIQRMHARQYEVYAGFLTHTDSQIGRLVEALDRVGVLDNTLLLILSDNGASAEGGQHGTFNVRRAYASSYARRGSSDEPLLSVEANLAHMTDWGGFRTYPIHSWGWACAGNTPFWLWKRYTWLGGTRAPLVAHWPANPKFGVGIRSQFCHAVDILPTVLEACGVVAPEVVDGISQQPINGSSLVPSFVDAGAPAPRSTQYFEMIGSRSIWHGRWKATTNHVSQGLPDEDNLMDGSRDFRLDHWSLFDLDEDFSEAVDVSAEYPEVVRELQDMWMVEAGRNNVMPMSDLFALKVIAERPDVLIPATYPVGRRAVFRPGSSPIRASAIPFLGAGFTIMVEAEVAAQRAEGVLFAYGDWHGGFAMYAADGILCFTAAPIGEFFTVRATSPLGRGRYRFAVNFVLKDDSLGELTLSVDGASLNSTMTDASIGMLIMLEEYGGRLRLGYDHGFPVCDDYQPPFRWQGVIHEVTVDTPGVAPKPSEEAEAWLKAD